MNPWWLRPAADDKPTEGSSDERPKSEASRPREPTKKSDAKRPSKPSKPPKPDQKRVNSGQRRSRKGRSRGGSGSGSGKPSRPRLAILIDIEALARWVTDLGGAKSGVTTALEGISTLGKVGLVRAYGEIREHATLARECEDAGCEMVDSSPAEARFVIALDAMEICLGRDSYDGVALVSAGDGWLPLILKLKALGKVVIGVAPPTALSGSAAAAFYRCLDPSLMIEDTETKPTDKGIEAAKAPVFSLLVDTIQSLEPGSQGVIWGSTLKREMHSRNPEFDESRHGYKTFSHLLEDADRYEVIQLERDDPSGNYYVAGLAGE